MVPQTFFEDMDDINVFENFGIPDLERTRRRNVGN